MLLKLTEVNLHDFIYGPILAFYFLNVVNPRLVTHTQSTILSKHHCQRLLMFFILRFD